MPRTNDDSIDERFWSLVQKTDGCWEWLGSTGRGYGLLAYQGQRHSAHVLSWVLHHGDVPAGLCVMHLCDNPGCVRPDHLVLGTQAANMIDKMRKRRGGDVTRKLTYAIAQEIRDRILAGESRGVVSSEYGISLEMTHRIITGRSWTTEPANVDATADELRRGSGNPQSKLTADQVQELRRRYAAGGVTQEELGREYGINQRTVSRIVRRTAWWWVEDSTAA